MTKRKLNIAVFSLLVMIIILFILKLALPTYIKDFLKDTKVFKNVSYLVAEPSDYPPGSLENGDGGAPIFAVFNDPSGIYVDSEGIIFICERRAHRVRMISDGKITTLAGNGRKGYSGDHIKATIARLDYPEGIIGDSLGNIYVADSQNQRIRKISPNGMISTVAGTGDQGYSGDGGLAINARLNTPFDICIGTSGCIYIADWGNHAIRKVSPDGIITTIAGTGQPGFSGDGGAATDAMLKGPYGLGIDRMNNLYIADSGNNRVRKVDTLGIITTIAGNGKAGYSGNNGPAIDAMFNSPQDILITPSQEIVVNDEHNHCIRKISRSGIIKSFIGTGKPGFSGDGGPAGMANLNDPEYLWLDSMGNLFLSDGDNNRIRVVDRDNIITTIAGGGKHTF